jgi:hypothetical protein
MRHPRNPWIKERSKDIAMQERIRARTNYSLAVLGMGAVYRGSGRFLNIRSSQDPPRDMKKYKL